MPLKSSFIIMLNTLLTHLWSQDLCRHHAWIFFVFFQFFTYPSPISGCCSICRIRSLYIVLFIMKLLDIPEQEFAFKQIKLLHKYAIVTEGDWSKRKTIRYITGFGFQTNSTSLKIKVAHIQAQFYLNDLIIVCNCLWKKDGYLTSLLD